jgi:trk system potassium uptake protein TrkH
MFARDGWVLLIVAALIVGGGLGFAVLAEIWSWLRRPRWDRLSVHSRIVLVMSGGLLILGGGAIAVLDWHHALASFGTPEKLAHALFQSATLRTAGFSSIPIGALSPAILLMMLAFMFVGASPGGTGGGIKTTTAAVLLGVIPAIARRKPDVVFFGRRVPLLTVYRSAAIMVVAGGIILLASALLVWTQEDGVRSLVFEAFSAFGTVGLSLGATQKLDPIGKIIIVGVMFFGRIGPLTLAIMLGRATAGRVAYPDSKIVVG